jgi:tRNA(fMet)-specific endonuclease VapC
VNSKAAICFDDLPARHQHLHPVSQRHVRLDPAENRGYFGPGISLCSVVKAELIYGAVKSARPQRNLSRLNPFFSRFASFPFDDAAAAAYGEIRARLERAGTPIGPNDLCIAAIATASGLTLVSHNSDEFSRVEGLQLTDWE